MKDRKKLFMAFYITVITALALVAATYAWMSIAATPTVARLNLYVVADSALEISDDNNGEPLGDWGSMLLLKELSISPAELTPVTFSAEQGAFLYPTYGLDGRIISLEKYISIFDSDDGSSAADGESDTEYSEASGNGNEKKQYIYTKDFWMRTGSSDCNVTLTMPVEREAEELGSGTFVIGKTIWNNETFLHEDGGNGAENCIRIAFLIYGSEDEESDDANKGMQLVIYEPNAGVVNNEYIATGSIDGAEYTYEGIYKLIRQYPTAWSENDPPLEDTVYYTPGEFFEDDSTALFLLKAGEERHIRMFIWIEGNDAECNAMIEAGEIMANLQFHGDDGKISPIYPD